ncbi:MAG: hypothetical protein KGR26_13400 [Cyanobacteria bacterium REEB65]|nr:hypothetical protein [Cyanobacteria bacterium REEB65]
MTQAAPRREALAGLERLVNGLFDYAGMFPPAALSYEEALRKAAGFARALVRPHLVACDAVLSPDALARTTPAVLAESGFGPDALVRIAALGQAAADPTMRILERNERTFGERPGQRVVSYEVRLETDLTCNEAIALLDTLAPGLASGGIRLVAEPQWRSDRWQSDIADLASGAAIANARLSARPSATLPRPIGIKVRGSGPTAISRAALAQVVAACADRGIPFKATAGLHHPFADGRHDNHLGFLSLAAAVRLRQGLGAAGFAVAQIEACLAASDPAEFHFEAGVRWRDWAIGQAALEGACQDLPFSIGSCSLSEPDEDLVELFGH